LLIVLPVLSASVFSGKKPCREVLGRSRCEASEVGSYLFGGLYIFSSRKSTFTSSMFFPLKGWNSHLKEVKNVEA
jgi:hypothetical protein